MKTIAQLAVNVILTFEDEPQEFMNVVVNVPNIPTLREQDFWDVEVDVLEQIINAYMAEAGPVDHLETLVKISLCYTTPPSHEATLQRMLKVLIRNNAKYYFQPNQISEAEERLQRRMPRVAQDTREFA